MGRRDAIPDSCPACEDVAHQIDFEAEGGRLAWITYDCRTCGIWRGQFERGEPDEDGYWGWILVSERPRRPSP